VFKFPIEAGDVLRAIEAAIGRRVNPIGDKGPPAFARPDAVTSHRALMGLEEPSTVALPGRRLARARATAGGVRASA
jgi:hypothetical protein